jgi:hypothetical protein
MQQHDSMPLSTLSTERQGGGTTAAGVSLMEVSTFMTEQLKAVARMEARMDKQASEAKAEMEAQRVASTAHMEAQRIENDKLRTEAAETRVEAVAARLRDQQLIMLQARLEVLGVAKLLTDDELFAVEDVIADSSVEASGDGQVAMLLALSARMASDSAFARQLRRKVVAQ